MCTFLDNNNAFLDTVLFRFDILQTWVTLDMYVMANPNISVKDGILYITAIAYAKKFIVGQLIDIIQRLIVINPHNITVTDNGIFPYP